MQKYALLREAVSRELSSRGARLALPPAASDEELLTVHSPEYLSSLKEGKLDRELERAIGLPAGPAMLERSRRSVGATLSACRAALEGGVACNLAGGTHHSFADRGEGFCVFNDSAVALRVLQSEGSISRALVVDTDVHQGNGTAAIFRNDPTVFTFSIHGEKNFPFRKEVSDLDVALPDGTEDEAYIEALQSSLDRLSGVPADLVVFQSGADPFVRDKLGRLSLSIEGLRRRDTLVLDWCARRRVPVAVTMGGGYAPDLADIVAIHLQTVEAALVHFHRFFSPAG